MTQSKGSLRTQLRNVHILASIALGAFIYSPWRNSASFPLIMGAVVFPVLSLTGLWMWQGHRISRWFKKPNNTVSATNAQK